MVDIPTNLNLQLIRELNNEGKNSTVYIMRDTQLNTDFVVKRIPKVEFENPEDYFSEASILYSVKHPNIVKIQHATDDKDYVYFSMPFYENGSLQSMMNSRFLTVQEIRETSLDFMNGLHYVHTKDLIHFDVKPTNILIGNNGKALLTDFGLSKYVNDIGMASPDKIYPCHVPPEMLAGSLMSNKADIYQSGMTLYRMCNGNGNYYDQIRKYNTLEEFTNDVINGKFPRRDYFLPHIPKKLRKIVKRALNINPDDRYSTVLDMTNEISSIDTNLDIAYYIDENTCSEVWEYYGSKTHKYRISLKPHGRLWDIIGEKIRITDNHQTFIHDFCSEGYTNKASALKEVGKILNS